MNRFFVPKSSITGSEIHISDKEEVRHLCHVLRLTAGDELFVSDGEGGGYQAVVQDARRNEVLLHIKKTLKKIKRNEQKVRISLGCAIPKSTRFEDIVDKCTQLGADEIVPLVTERTLLKKEVFDKKLARLRRIVLAAAKQSGVLFLPILDGAVMFSDFIAASRAYNLRLIPNLSQAPATLKSAVEHFQGGRVLVAIGPEGDFTKQELDTAFGAGFGPVTLGPAVLRVDTAALACMSFLRLQFDLWNSMDFKSMVPEEIPPSVGSPRLCP